MHTYGVVLAGGVGARLGLDFPKQMVKVAGKTILEHTVAAMSSSPAIDELIVMVTPGGGTWVEYAKSVLGGKYPKITHILEGGTTRSETTRRFLDMLGDEEAKLILHDAVRPLVDDRVIAECVDALDNYGAVDVVIPSADTIVAVDHEKVITGIPNRDQLRRGQTPQAFRASVLRNAYDKAIEDPHFHATDDCGVVLKYCPDVKIKCIEGSENNIKVTYPIDLFIADKLFQLVHSPAPSLSNTELMWNLSGKTIVVLGGSYGIGAEIVRMARYCGAKVIPHSRSTTGLDVRDYGSIERALDGVAKAYGSIDAVVLTAGELNIGPLGDMSATEIADSIHVNLLSPAYVAKAAHKHLAKTKGHLLFFTSSSYTRGRENYALYSASKAGVVNLTQALAEEWSNAEIKVNAINPERTDTPMRRAAFGDEPQGSLLDASDVAQASLNTICSPITGCVIDVRREQFASKPQFAVVAESLVENDQESGLDLAIEEEICVQGVSVYEDEAPYVGMASASGSDVRR